MIFKLQQKGSLNKNTVRVVFQKMPDIEVVEEEKGKVLRVGLGKKEMTRRLLILLVRKIITTAKKHKIKKISLTISDIPVPKSVTSFELGSLLAENALMANFEFNMFKTRPKEGWNEVQEVVIYGTHDKKFKDGVAHGIIVGEEINKSRILSNTPGGDMTPKLLAQKIKSACAGTGIRVSILGKKELERLKMGAVLGVARGSEEEPKFIILEYKKGKKSDKPIVLVGKGVTFDTGGLNLKPSNSILDMHLDMSGGAAVAHSVIAAAKLKLKKNIVALIPAVENMPSGSSYRPGDILKSMSGKTIEVLNTDAEGRLILADALTYAKKYTPRLVVDVATLTGASLVALGQRASALFTKDQKLNDLCMRLGEESGEYLWPLPLWEEYEEEVKGNFADVANIPPSGTSYGGAINGAMFLAQFADGYPWVHIDMAPRMTSITSDHLAKGSAGAPIRFLVKLLETY
ncbi:MAG: leucyl aminopeptidase [Parcubacteria group bacterium]|nr:leucyl aminopeptidase [Parcubacteria group bacterium]